MKSQCYNAIVFGKSLKICCTHWSQSTFSERPVESLPWLYPETLQWRHNGRDGVSNHQPHHCYSTVYSGADQRKHSSSASLAFVSPVNLAASIPINSKHMKYPAIEASSLFVITFNVSIHLGRELYFKQENRPITMLGNECTKHTYFIT